MLPPSQDRGLPVLALGLLAAGVACFLPLVRAVGEYLRTPIAVELSPILFLLKYRSGRTVGFSWAEVSHVLPGGRKAAVGPGPLHDLKIVPRRGKDLAAPNLSFEAARELFIAFYERTKKLSPDEARLSADRWFDIKRY